ncbi:GNAT family N-acetyltransferase [Methanospirillum sp. J.3.6.1-F.2.7.3]|jgi:phosphinothricin acetyltransferase|uniref:GNAT family N-acetyltransferase n=1 Tax=Methanospirillum purgamenti TaxID=2834276 RepID=A0A8E7B4H1_9EURY|nr:MULTISPECIES: GNAT family N-acetyltransferase [Methanospirillum]MDX8550764.1 GNAT family N-acetyltransferase [Methanospirillum hungatei]QVV90317.1 GNAT family N-acetyltransferase [Methanospirillum sp. J.3.6.1-F.2.7.3]
MTLSTELLLSPIIESDKEPIIALFNYYIEHTYAAFLETPLPLSYFDAIMPVIEHYPSVSVKKNGVLIGFGFLRPHNPMPAFRYTAVISYFLNPEYTGKRIGSMMLNYLIEKAREKGIKSILAEISSLNPGSVKFHEKHGFIHRGQFERVGVKNGKEFDTIWMQKIIN